MSKFNLLFLLLMGGSLLTLSNCGEDDPNEEMNDRLQGDWEVESFTRDGVEQMNFVYSSFDWEFTKEGPNEGELEWDLIGTNGNSANQEFDYEINNEGRELEIDGDDLDIDLDGDDLRLEGTIDAERWIFELEKD